jgi:serine protease Do
MRAPVAVPLAQALASVVDRIRRCTVQVRTRDATTGAGVLWGRGLVVTNAHVIQGDQAIVALSDGGTARARVVAYDPRRDLAALEFEPFGDSDVAAIRGAPALRAGELAIAVGHPGGVVGVATLGVIHRADGEPEGRRPRWVRADVRLAPGFSGGPLADAAGRVIGINTMVQGGMALAIPAAAAAAWLARATAVEAA